MGAGRSYSESIHQDKERMWLISRAAPLARGTAGNAHFVGRTMFPGPIRLLKYGLIIGGTIGGHTSEYSLFRNSSDLGNITAASGGLPNAISSTVLDTQYIVDVGSYLTVVSSTAVSSTGSVSLFIDYVPLFTGLGAKWSV